MKKFFYPKSIAVIGASADEEKVTNNIISNLLEMGFQGGLYPVGKAGGEIFGLPIYRSLKDIPDAVELLVIMVPADAVPGLLTDAGEAGIDRAVLITAGFNELGRDEDILTKKIKEIAEKYSIRFIGPNCQGVICTESRVCVPFWPATRELVKNGGVSVITQSGSLASTSTFDLSHEIDGINKVASIGNKLDVDELDLLEYLIEDPETKIIVLHLESLANGRRLFELAKNSPKPIIVFKSNTSGKISQIALSHTAALASDDMVVEAAMTQAGILRAHSFRDMIEICKALSLPLIKGKNLAVLSGSGGMGIIAEDTVQKENLHLAQLPASLIQKISTMGNWKLHKIANPLDLGGIFKNSDILNIVDLILSFEEIDGTILSIFGTGPPMYKPFNCSEVVAHVEGITQKRLKPVAMNIVSNPFFIAQLKRDKGFPTFDTVEDAVGALSAQWKYRRYLNRIRSPYRNMKDEKTMARKILAAVHDDSAHPGDLLAMKLASSYGIRCEMPVIAANLEEASLKAAEIGYPVAMKISSPDISHKTDMGGVKTEIRDEKELKQAYFEIMDEVKRRSETVHINGVMLQKMITGGIELILGGKQDHDFGPVVMFGMGGIFAETLKDVSFRLAPICREEAYEMIEEIRGFPLLTGVRGQKPCDIPALADALVSLSILLADFPEITELDLNPVKIFNEGKGLIVLDGRLKS